MNTLQKGDVACLEVARRAIEKGMIVSRPLQESARYDLVIDDGERLHRVQVKYADGSPGRGASGAVACELRRQNRSNKGGERRYTADEVDAILVYVPKAGIICWLPIEMLDGRRSVSIRYEAAKNNQSAGCVMADDYRW